jgi:hypothetical protein
MDGERMWVDVTAATEGRYEGTLLNEPRHMTSIAAGARVVFGPEHVAAYEWSADELGYDPGLTAWARREAAVPGGERPARVSLRPLELRAPDGDSGWILGRGDEQGGEHTDETIFGWSQLGWLTDLYPELEPVFRANEGDWRWDEEAQKYVRAG